MIVTTRQPHARLAPLLHGSYVGWVDDTRQGFTHRELPFPGLPLIITLGATFRLADTRKHGEPMRVGSFVAGLDDWFTESHSPAGTCAIQVNFTPIGARQLLGIPLEQLTRRIVSLEDFLGTEGRRLEQRIAEESSWAGRFDQLERWLLERLTSNAAPTAALSWLWGELTLSKGTASIGALGASLGWSRQRMVTECRRELGMSPKLLARIVRFHAMTGRLRSGRTRSWSSLAAECGYHDQAHLTHEVGALAGCTPGQLPGHLLLS